MDFKEATDLLLNRVDHKALARALGVSVASIRQARLKQSASAHRAPPPDWEEAVARLAADQAEHYRLLGENLTGPKSGGESGNGHKGDERRPRLKSGTH